MLILIRLSGVTVATLNQLTLLLGLDNIIVRHGLLFILVLLYWLFMDWFRGI
jgi:hypothetical protein